MRVVLDTNVLISAALKRNSTPATAVSIVQQDHILLKSTATERQLLDVAARPYFVRLIGPDTLDWLRQLISAAEPVAITERIAACRDPRMTSF
jgi:predicted nucleic acid-binding protein